jgi:hypothetical protein
VGKPTNALQAAIHSQPVYQTHGGGDAQHRFGDEGLGYCEPLTRGPPNAAAVVHKLLHAHPVQDVDEFLKFGRERIKFGPPALNQFNLY